MERDDGISVPSFVNKSGNYINRASGSTNSNSSTANREERTTSKSTPARGGKKRKKKKKPFFRIMILILLILSASLGCVAATVQHKIGNTLNLVNRDESQDLDLVDVSKMELSYDSDIINILLVGADKRADWSQAGRSDSVMIATMDLKHNKLKLTSLMRDMYLPIPGYGENRFNAAYSFGGVKLLYQTIANNFGIKLDGYAVVDFASFKAVINKLGGVDITLTQAEADYLTTAYKKGSVLKLKPGLNTMNGAQALAYTRIRQDSKADFGRTERQRKVVQALFTKAKSMPLQGWLSIAQEILPYVTTDISDKEIYSYMISILKMGTTEINQFRLPIDGSFTNRKIRGMDVLVTDTATNKKALYNFIFNDTKPDSSSAGATAAPASTTQKVQ